MDLKQRLSTKESCGMLALVVFLLIVIAYFQSGPSTPKHVSAPAKKYFNFTSAQYIKRFNESLAAIEQPMRMRKKKETDTGENKIIQVTINKNLTMLIQERKDNGLVDYLTFIGTGDGTLNSGVDLLFGLACVVMAVENPQMTRDERGDISRDLGATDKKFPNAGEERTFVRKGVEYKLSKSKELGIWLLVHPI